MSPFLSEKDYEIKFLARNEGAYRGLSSLFPGITLKTLFITTKIANEKKFFLGGIRVATNKRRYYGGTTITHAAKTLHEELKKMGYSTTHKTCQNILNLCTDFRLLFKLSKEYKIHSYSYPMLWFSDKDHLKFKCYFIDKLLFEDGDYFYAILKMHSEKGIEKLDDEYTGRSNYYGKVLHEIVLDLLEKKINSHFSHEVKFFLKTKIRDIKKQLDKIERNCINNKRAVPRRMELEYTVRRDWLYELGLLSNIKGEIKLSTEGEKLFKNIENEVFDTNFFTKKSLSVLNKVYNFTDRRSADKTKLFEMYYDRLTKMKGNILETLVLINSIIFLELPNFYGDRDSLLSQLLELSKSAKISLVVENGYRTRDYYVKRRMT